jgi:hypothetical protein
VSRRMGLFVVARLAARHGIRVRLRPAPTGGLTALVWLPDETVTHDTAGSPLTPRRFDRDGPGSPNSLAVLSPPAASTGQLPSVTDAGPAPVSGASQTTGPTRQPPRLRARPARTFAGDTGPIRQEIVVPPAATVGADNWLPVFESVESDWFRRGRHIADRATAAVDNTTSSASWTSAADEGWRAAEAVSKPSSGGVTPSGLPKRIPRANLVPGTVGADGQAAPPPPPVRSAVATRDRFASFQRGVREARAADRDDGAAGGEGNVVT